MVRERRSIDETYKNNELNQNIITEDAHGDFSDNVEFNVTVDEIGNNTTKRDLTDAVDLETLKEGVDQLKRMLDLTSLSEKLIWDLSVYWWILLLFLLLAFILSFCWIGKKGRVKKIWNGQNMK